MDLDMCVCVCVPFSLKINDDLIQNDDGFTY